LPIRQNRLRYVIPLYVLFTALFPLSWANAQSVADVPIQVDGTSFSVQILKDALPAFNGEEYVWLGVPDKFQGWHYTQTLRGVSSHYILTGKKDGLIYIAASRSLDPSIFTGWTQVSGMTFKAVGTGIETFQLYTHPYHAGDTVDVFFGTFLNGLVLAPNIDAPQVDERLRLLRAAEVAILMNLTRSWLRIQTQ